MSNTFSGSIIHIGDLNAFTTSAGETFSREFTVEQTDNGYSHQATFTLYNALAKDFRHAVGDSVTVFFAFAGYASSQDPSRHFNRLRAWRID